MVKLFTGSASHYLSEHIAHYYNQPLGDCTMHTFSDGELQPLFNESVRGDDVFIIQSTFPPADNLMELLLMIDGAKRASAKQIAAVLPYFGFSRQDRKDMSRVPIGAKLVADLLTTAGATRIVTMDLHADQIQGFFNIPVEQVYASRVFIPFIESLHLNDLVFASPDVGGSKRANVYAKHFDAPLVICYKQRKVANQVSQMELIGDVQGKNVIIIDDMVDTAGTICKAAELMKKNGAQSIRAFCTHPILSGEAYDLIENSALDVLYVTDSIPLKQNTAKITVLSVAALFCETIQKIYAEESLRL